MVTSKILEENRLGAKTESFEAEPHALSFLGTQWDVINVTFEVHWGAESEVHNIVGHYFLRVTLFDAIDISCPLQNEIAHPTESRLAKSGPKVGPKEWGVKVGTEDEEQRIVKTQDLAHPMEMPWTRRYFDRDSKKKDWKLLLVASLESIFRANCLQTEDNVGGDSSSRIWKFLRSGNRPGESGKCRQH